MFSRIIQKEKAVKLRKEGKTYSEILAQVPVAKSTLSSWLHSVGLAKKQKQLITEKRLAAALRGAQSRKNLRLSLTKEIWEKSEKEIGVISHRELWLLGTMLYWAEGTKEKSYRPGTSVEFTNSDSFMIKVFLCWLFEICKVKNEEIAFEIYIHVNYLDRIDDVKKFWSISTGFPLDKFGTIYYKKHNPKPFRKNVGIMYNGNLRIRVNASSNLLRKITGWTMGIYNNYC